MRPCFVKESALGRWCADVRRGEESCRWREEEEKEAAEVAAAAAAARRGASMHHATSDCPRIDRAFSEPHFGSVEVRNRRIGTSAKWEN
jgi:hypothetical protein